MREDEGSRREIEKRRGSNVEEEGKREEQRVESGGKQEKEE